jgi:hypothetical protein
MEIKFRSSVFIAHLMIALDQIIFHTTFVWSGFVKLR